MLNALADQINDDSNNASPTSASQPHDAQTSNDLIEGGLDTCKVAFDLMETVKVLSDQVLGLKARCLIEMFQFYLSQCTQYRNAFDDYLRCIDRQGYTRKFLFLPYSL